MSNAAIDVSEHDAIAKAVQHYIDGAKSGSGGGLIIPPFKILIGNQTPQVCARSMSLCSLHS